MMPIKLQFKQIDTPFTSYYVYREESPYDIISKAEANTISPLNPLSLTLDANNIAEYNDTTAVNGTTYYYILRCITGDGLLVAGQSVYSNVVEYEASTLPTLEDKITVTASDYLEWWTSLDKTSFVKDGGGQPNADIASGGAGEEVITWNGQLSTGLSWNAAANEHPSLTSDSVRHLVSTANWAETASLRIKQGWQLSGTGSDDIGMSECLLVFGLIRYGTENPSPDTDVVFFQISQNSAVDIFRIGQTSAHTPWSVGKVTGFRMWARSDGVAISDAGSEVEGGFVGTNSSGDWANMGGCIIAYHLDWNTGKIMSYFMNDDKVLYTGSTHDIIGGAQNPVAGTNAGVAMGTTVTGTAVPTGAVSWPHAMQEMVLLQKPNITFDEITDAMAFVADRMMLGMDHNIESGNRNYVFLPLIKDYSNEGTSLSLDIQKPNSADFYERGWIGSGWNRIKGTLPSWAANTDEPLYVECTVGINEPNPEGISAGTIFAITNGTDPFLDKMAVYSSYLNDIQIVELGVGTGSANTYTNIFRAGWELKIGRTVRRYKHSNLSNHQGIANNSATEIWSAARCGGTNENNLISRYDLTSEKITGIIDTNNLSGLTAGISSLAFDTSGDLWFHAGDKIIKLDVTASLANKRAVPTITVTLASFAFAAQGIEFTDVGGTEYCMIGEFNNGSSQGFIYIIDSSILTDGSTFTAGTDEFKRFDFGTGIQGFCVDNNNEFHVMKQYENHTTTPVRGQIHSYGDVDTLITGTSDEAVLNATSLYAAPSVRGQDICKSPVGDGIWSICDGDFSPNDYEDFGGTIWHSKLDPTELVENKLGVYFTGSVIFGSVGDIQHQIFLNDILIKIIRDENPSTVNIGATADTIHIGSNLRSDVGTTANKYDNSTHKGSLRNFLIQPKKPLALEKVYPPVVESTVIPITLINPDAETGDTTGWTTESGSFDVVTATPAAYQGTYFFVGLATATSVASQRVDLLSATGLTGTQIDNLAATGDIWVRLTWIGTWFGNSDIGAMGIRNLDTSQVLIDDNFSINSVNQGFTQLWRHFAVGHFVTVGTRYIDIVYDCTRISGSDANFSVDDIKVNLYHN